MKVFDTLDWAFLLVVLRKMGFSECWVAWIHALRSTKSTMVLLNSLSGDRIANKRGFRHAPNSPPPLHLVIEVLYLLIEKVT